MEPFSKDEISQALARQRALPLFNCGDAATGMQVLDEANLKAWFAAGVHCVGMGSHLVDAKTLADGNFADLADRARRLTAILATV
jgi:2-keto-3-deoxy-6-phosphogluconate aldolase